MDEAQELPSEEQAGIAGEALEGLGMPEEAAEGLQADEGKPEQDPVYVQKRLKQQERAHKREMRELQQQMMQMQQMQQMQQQMSAPQQQGFGQPMQQQDPYGQPQQDQGMGAEDQRIQRAVQMALQHKEMQERQSKEAERMAHVQKQYQALQENLDNASLHYDDFDDVVRHGDAPYSEAMRDAALLIPNAADVLYKLGKNKDELKRISALHPLEQAKEMVKLSIALTQGEGSKGRQVPKTLGQVKSNPVTNSQAITDKTPVSEIRRRMKAGWK